MALRQTKRDGDGYGDTSSEVSLLTIRLLFRLRYFMAAHRAAFLFIRTVNA